MDTTWMNRIKDLKNPIPITINWGSYENENGEILSVLMRPEKFYLYMCLIGNTPIILYKKDFKIK